MSWRGVVSLDGLAPVRGESVADTRPAFHAWTASAGGWSCTAPGARRRRRRPVDPQGLDRDTQG